MDIFLAGCAGGVGQLVIACPTDLVKVKLQIQTGETVYVYLYRIEKRSDLQFVIRFIMQICLVIFINGIYGMVQFKKYKEIIGKVAISCKKQI